MTYSFAAIFQRFLLEKLAHAGGYRREAIELLSHSEWPQRAAKFHL
jgi:hypothetical protein